MNTTIYAKYVYLFEMDSVRTSRNQVKQAIRALYHETIVARNIVVLSYNQVVDSIPFISMLKDENSFADILHLFELGYLKINQFGNTRTIIQYLLDQLDRLLDASEDDNSGFQFSGFPVKQSQRRLLALIRRCLINTDLSEIYEYIGKKKTDAEIQDLFLKSVPEPDETEKRKHPEYAGYERISGRMVIPPSDSVPELRETLKTLAVILENLLKLSAIRDICLPPKKAVRTEIRSFSSFLDLVMEKPDLVPDAQFVNALEVIRGLSAYQEDPSDPKKHSQRRSDYHNQLKEIELEVKKDSALKGKEYTDVIRKYRYAEAVIDACYNYTCEASILNISRHYDVIENKDGLLVPDSESFYSDCRRRIEESIDDMECFMEKKISDDKDSIDYIPNLRFPRLGHLNKPDGRILYCETMNKVPRYEYKADVLFNRTTFGRIFDFPEVLRNFLLALALLIIVNILLDWLQQFMQFPSTPGWIIVKCICAIFAGELISFAVAGISEDDAFNILLSFVASLVLPVSVYLFAGFVQNALNLTHPAWTVLKFVLIIVIGALEAGTFIITGNKVVYDGSLFEIVGRFTRFVMNEFYNYHHFETAVHTNKTSGKNADEYQLLPLSDPALPLPETRAMKQYDRFIKDADGKYFSDPDTAGYHFYSRKDETERKNLYRYEEVTGKQFGLLYRSDYSTLLVDPVTRKDGSGLMTYERVLPGKLLASRYDGVVIVPRINDRYVLIRQYRHALRRDQLCFPRGYAENDDIFLDAERELKEEIGGVLKSGSALTLLGSYTADSGLSSKTTAIVLAELDSYSSSDDPDEAINTIEEYTLDKLTALFRSGEIDDGFTIASLLSLREYQKPQGTV